MIAVPKISTEFIRLEQFLKFCGVADTGGTAKQMIQASRVQYSVMRSKISAEKKQRCWSFLQWAISITFMAWTGSTMSFRQEMVCMKPGRKKA